MVGFIVLASPPLTRSNNTLRFADAILACSCATFRALDILPKIAAWLPQMNRFL